MSLIVTPGSPSAEAYWTIEQINAYAVARGKAFPITGSDAPAAVAAAEAAARRGAAWLDATYRARFPGAPTDGTQAMEWPRTGATFRGEAVADDVIPVQIGRAAAEAAIRELAAPGSMSPDRKRGGRIREVGAGSARVVFADGAPAGTTFAEIDGILGGLLVSSGGASVNVLRV